MDTMAVLPKLKMFQAADLAGFNAYSADILVIVTGVPF